MAILCGMHRLVLAITLMISTSSLAQSIAKNTVDNFTETLEIHSDWEYISTDVYKTRLFARLRSEGESKFLDIRMVGLYNNVNIYHDEAQYIMFDNKQKIELYSDRDYSGCSGCGTTTRSGLWTYGISASFQLSSEQWAAMKTHNIKAFRFKMSDEVMKEHVKKRDVSTLKKTAILIDSSKK